MTASSCIKNKGLKPLLLAAVLSTGLHTGAVLAQAAPSPQTIDIPAGNLAQALDRLGEQTGVLITYEHGLVQGHNAPRVSGPLSPVEALRRLLSGSGIQVEAVNEKTFVLRPAAAPPARTPTQRSGADQQRRSGTSSMQEPVTDLEEIVVTGTRIRGAQPSSPLVMITQEEMRLSGHNNLGEVIRALPQNFSGGQNPGVLIGAGGGVANQNVTGASGLNLRGLGPDATLTLLNGARLSYSGFVQATDVAHIPVAAIDRMEVLLDGASALYGSDAVGGVVNIVLKRDYSGAELTARSGRASAGGYGQTQFSAVAGDTWSTGGFLIAGESSHNDQVLASQRDYLRYIPRPDLLSIYPESSQDGILLSGHQALGARAELALDAFYTKRSMEAQYVFLPLHGRYGAQTAVYGLSPSLQVSLSGDWSMRLHGFAGEDNSEVPQRTVLIDTGAQTSRSRTRSRNRVKAAGVELEGPVFELPGGQARASLGGGWRKTQYDEANLVTGRATVAGATNANRYLYGELNLPLVDQTQNIRFLRHLSLNGAVRYEDYDSFGDTATPKLGAIWEVTPTLNIRASWGKSFKAPTLSEQFKRGNVGLRTAASLGIPNAPVGATVFTAGGGNPDLAPERAEVVTAGFVVQPSFLPGATIELGWFDIDYTQRVVNPFRFPVISQWGQAWSDPAYTSFIVRNPTVAQQQQYIQSAASFVNFSGAAYDPSSVIAIFDDRNVNASSQTARGVDLDIRYVTSIFEGTASITAGGSWITESRRRLIDGVSTFDTAGVVAFPPKFKGRMGFGWSRSAFSATATVNHLAGLRNTAVVPSVKGDSMTTMDLVLDYAAQNDRLNGFGFNLAVTNVFNQRPPFVQPTFPFFVNYDSTNYSALGRVISASVTKTF